MGDSKMKMLHNNLLVKKLTKEQLGKILLPDSVDDQWYRGKVIEVGEKVEANIKKEDIIVFLAPPPHVGDYPSIDNDGNIVIPDTYVCAIEN
jgi:co-chaperonin GroES (HSP10)